MDFNEFKAPIEEQIRKMLLTGDLFVVDVEKDFLWNAYISSFPEGSNQMFRKRTEHDCSACRYFVKTMGRVVSIRNGELRTIWDAQIDNPAYNVVAKVMSQIVKAHTIVEPFLHGDRNVGQDKSVVEIEGKIETFRHFHCEIVSGRNQGPSFYRDRKDIAAELGEQRTTAKVFSDSLYALTVDSCETVLELIANKSLYRGEEHFRAVNTFLSIKREYDATPNDKKDLFVWSKLSSTPISVARIKNTAIGTLLVDLSLEVELEDAVRKFETSVMAPENYKRPTALVSKAMVEKAKEKVAELGIEDALERRHARMSDLSANDVLWVDRSVKGIIKDNVFDSVETKASVPKDLSRIEAIGIDTFLKDALPKITSLEVLVENKLTPNLVSLIAPLHASAKPLFKWGNGFSWTYAGEVADSIKERVKKAGGNVTGDLCCRLAWFNTDDLDLHMNEPRGGYISYANKVSSITGGQLDVDMNVHHLRRDAVENIYYGHRSKMLEGEYTLWVHNFTKRETKDVGFEAQIDYLGEVRNFSYGQAVSSRGHVIVAKMRYTHAGGLEFLESLPSTMASKTVWGVKTQDFAKVSAVTLSPNCWGGNGHLAGNRHLFFMLDGCISDERPRGFFNEFLTNDLLEHKKVLEIVGSKMKVEQTPNQLSGLGFSSTLRNEIIVRAKGTYNRTLKVMI